VATVSSHEAARDAAIWPPCRIHPVVCEVIRTFEIRDSSLCILGGFPAAGVPWSGHFIRE
jgi:hypothetical protein